MHAEPTDRVQIMQCRIGREYKLQDLPLLRVDGYCLETNTVYEFLGCFWHGHTCQAFCDDSTICGDNRAERYDCS